jgi:hypothetical protein
LLQGNSDRVAFGENPVVKIDPPPHPENHVLLNKTGSTSGFGAYLAVSDCGTGHGRLSRPDRSGPEDDLDQVTAALIVSSACSIAATGGAAGSIP